MIIKSKLIFLLLFCTSLCIHAQEDARDKEFVYTSISEALKNPEKVYRLNLSNQDVKIPKEEWLKFTKLEFLSLKNDHLSEIPKEIGYLTSLKTLDLSGNDFVTLPKTFKNLRNLEEIFLNDEQKFKLDKGILVLKELPSLRTMHLENDALDKLPKNFFKMNQIEELYLNNNRFLEVPREIKGLKNLKFVDLHENNLKIENQSLQNPGFGFKIVF